MGQAYYELVQMWSLWPERKSPEIKGVHTETRTGC